MLLGAISQRRPYGVITFPGSTVRWRVPGSDTGVEIGRVENGNEQNGQKQLMRHGGGGLGLECATTEARFYISDKEVAVGKRERRV